jgi:hypothetical protein
MKAFHFRLDPALRWRDTQLRMEQEAAARLASRLAALQNELNARHAELRSGSADLVKAGAAAFESWNAYVTRSKLRIRTIHTQILEARKALIIQTQKIAEARRNLRVLENLKENAHTQWTKDLDRETEAFAGEAFLAGIARDQARDQRREASASRATIEKRTGA